MFILLAEMYSICLSLLITVLTEIAAVLEEIYFSGLHDWVNISLVFQYYYSNNITNIIPHIADKCYIRLSWMETLYFMAYHPTKSKGYKRNYK